MPKNLSSYFTDTNTTINNNLANFLHQIKLVILGRGIQRHLPVKTLQAFTTSNFLLIYLEKGSITISHNNVKTFLSSGSIYLLLPLETYSLANINTMAYKYEYIYFSILPIYISKIIIRQVLTIGEDVFKNQWYFSFSTFLSHLFSNSFFDTLLLKQAVLTIIYRLIQTPSPFSMLLSYKGVKKEASLIDKSYQYTLKHLGNAINVCCLCKEIGTSQSNLNRTFQNVMGITTAHALTRFKVLLSLDMLNDGLPIKLIAKHFGYSSTSHFCRAFRSIMSTSPKQYLKLN